MDASKDMEELLKRIYMPSVFYFPKVFFTNLSSEMQKTLKEYHFFEDIGIIKANGDIAPVRRSINNIEIIKKDGVLEGNIFQLLEMKERLGNESFDFLLDKYLSNVKAWVSAYHWLLEYYDKQFSESSKTEKPLFEYQCTSLNNHLTQLNLKFQFNFNNTSPTNLLDVLSENKKTFPFDKSIYKNLKEGILNRNKTKESKTTRQHKKQILLTEHEADEFLLKTVFNMKLTPPLTSIK
ncbi:hypothetical protein [Thalassobellus suaedae]|uniref:Uncharacterized protein n=1 Tax=Thalassobellus suaedae TaxID=3074124 RepID=A0ABY9XWD1_9FLAO|nr:hypothetical protein RHP51_04270 [Flavobacteriaceae bacterium HL-DH14]